MLKPEKGNIVSIRTNKYHAGVKKSILRFFKIQIYKDPTLANLMWLQRYLKQLNETGESSEAIYNSICQNHAHLARAHQL